MQDRFWPWPMFGWRMKMIRMAIQSVNNDLANFYAMGHFDTRKPGPLYLGTYKAVLTKRLPLDGLEVIIIGDEIYFNRTISPKPTS